MAFGGTVRCVDTDATLQNVRLTDKIGVWPNHHGAEPERQKQDPPVAVAVSEGLNSVGGVMGGHA